MYDTIIIGAGPGGLTSSIYLNRSGLKTLLIEKGFSGGQMINTSEIENYTGFENINGAELSFKMESHAKKIGGTFVTEEVLEYDLSGPVKKIKTNKNEYESKTVILAMGAHPRKTGITGEEEYSQGGVSYCATCDGAFYRGKNVAVIGGGNTAVEDAAYLARFCEKVYIIHRRDEFRADQAEVKKLKAFENVEYVLSSLPEEILGSGGKVTGIKVKNRVTNKESVLEADAVFIAIGSIPNSDNLKDVELNENKNIITNQLMETNLKGVYAIGDIRNTPLRQVLTACSDGAIAAQSINSYIGSL
ncbi:MAG: thioredoxin-disulfide reductase [Lachnospirales bacterium]